MTSSGYCRGRRGVLAIGHSARDTYGMLLRRGVPLEAKPFQLGVRIEQPQAQVNAARYGRNADHPALGAADYNLVARAGGRDLFTFCMCAGGYVMPSVSEPGYFCTNGMSESRHDSPFANSGLVVTIDPDDTGQPAPAGGRPLPAAVRAAGVSGRRPDLRRADPVGPRLPQAGRPSRGKLPSSYQRGDDRRSISEDPPADRARSIERGLPVMDRRFHGLFLKDATLTGPESRGQLAGPHPAATRRRDRARPWPASTPAARGPATPGASSARPWTGCGTRHQRSLAWRPSSTPDSQPSRGLEFRGTLKIRTLIRSK